MDPDEILLDVEERMEKAAAVLKSALAGIRTGRANPGLVDSLRVEAYGSQVPIKQLASVGAPEPTQIVIRPYDPNTLKDIEKAIQGANLGLNPASDGMMIRIQIPELTEESRKELAKQAREIAEEGKIAVRKARQEAARQGRRLRLILRPIAPYPSNWTGVPFLSDQFALLAPWVFVILVALVIALYGTIVVGSFTKLLGVNHEFTLDHWRSVLFGYGTKAVTDTVTLRIRPVRSNTCVLSSRDSARVAALSVLPSSNSICSPVAASSPRT